MRLLFVFLCLLIIMPLAAQEEDFLDWDIGSLFDEPPPPPAETAEAPEAPFSPFSLIRRPGFTIDGTFEFLAGIVPGWDVGPWDDGFSGEYFSWRPVTRLRARFDLDTQISEILRIRTALRFTVPGYDIELREFFFDYILANRVFFRGGRFNQTWGVSPNFAFTNLVARVPDRTFNQEPFIMRVEIPVGIGGFQFLALTRRDLFGDEDIQSQDVGYGARLNLAFPRLDMYFGAFFQERMPMRSFLSFRTTIGRTEWYNEWLGAIDGDNPGDAGGAVNLGFVRDFFSDRLTVNGEVFLNTERRTYWFRPETSITEADALPFNDGLNFALNLFYRVRGRANLRFFVQTLYAPIEHSARLVPGFRMSPWEHLELYFAVPMALGSRDGHYYRNTADPQGNRPFAIVMMFSLRGSIRMGQDL